MLRTRYNPRPGGKGFVTACLPLRDGEGIEERKVVPRGIARRMAVFKRSLYFYFTSTASSKLDMMQQSTDTDGHCKEELIDWTSQWTAETMGMMQSKRVEPRRIKDADAFEREFAAHLRAKTHH